MTSSSRALMDSLSEDLIQLSEVTVSKDETLSEVERVQQYGFASFPHDGAQGVLLFVGGNRDHALLISADHPLERKKLEKGEVAVYSKWNNFVYLKSSGGVEIASTTFKVSNGSDDLVSLLVDLVAELEKVTVTTALGPQPFINLAAFTALKLKLTAFKE